MYNAVQCLDLVRDLVREKTAATWPDRKLIDFLNMGHVEVARSAHALFRTVFFEATTGVPTYPLVQVARDFIALRRVDWRDETLGEFTDLDRWNLQANAFQDTNQTEIQKVGIEAGQLVFYPAPTVTRYTAAVVTVTRDSVSVAVTAGTPAANGATKGWIFGVGATPTKWYAVKSVTDTAPATITLQEPFREETAAGQACVLSSGAVRLVYSAVPPPLRVITNGAASNPHFSQGTVTFTLDAGTIVGVGTAWNLEIQGGMEIGPGTAAALPQEHKWLKVRGRIDGTNLRLWEPWRLDTAAAQNYILCDQSPFCSNYDNGMGGTGEERSLPAIHYAAAMALSTVQDAGAWDRENARFMGSLHRVRQDVAQQLGQRTVPVKRIALPYHPFFGGRVQS